MNNPYHQPSLLHYSRYDLIFICNSGAVVYLIKYSRNVGLFLAHAEGSAASAIDYEMAMNSLRTVQIKIIIQKGNTCSH